MGQSAATNRIFSRQDLEVLLGARRWRLASSLCPPDMKPLDDRRLLRWASRFVERHAQQEVVVGLRGAAFFSLGGTVYPCGPADVFFIDAGEGHGYPYPPSYPDADHLLIQITAKAVLFRTYSCQGGTEMPARPTHALRGAGVVISLLHESLARLRENPALPPQFRRFELLGILRLIIGQLVMQGFVREEQGTATKKAYQKRMIETVQEHIRETAGRNVSLAGLSLLTGYSRHHLARLYRSLCGQTIHQYMDSVRAAKVGQLLASGMSKKEISTILGFSCPAAFSRWLTAHPSFLVRH